MKKIGMTVVALMMSLELLMLFPLQVSAASGEVREDHFNGGTIITSSDTIMGVDGIERQLPDGWKCAPMRPLSIGEESYRDGIITVVRTSDYDDVYYNMHEYAYTFSDRLYTYGAMDPDGTILFEIRAQEMGVFREGLAKVLINGKWSFVDPTGKLVITDIEADKVDDFKDGLALITVSSEKGGPLTGAIDKGGNLVIPCEYYVFLIGSDGLILVRREGEQEHFLNFAGEQAIPERFSDAFTFRDGLAEIRTDTGISFIDTMGKPVCQMPIELARERDHYNETYFSDGLLLVLIPTGGEGSIENGESVYGYMDRTGKVTITLPEDCRSRDFHEGLAYVRTDDGDGSIYYIDKQGRSAIPLPKDVYRAGDFYEGYAVYYTETETGDLQPHVIKNPLTETTASDTSREAQSPAPPNEEEASPQINDPTERTQSPITKETTPTPAPIILMASFACVAICVFVVRKRRKS